MGLILPERPEVGGWADLPFWRDGYPEVRAALAADERVVLPPAGQVFAALAATSPDAVRAVILGQDPYPTPGHAHGFAFSVAPDVRPLPRSLGNLCREMAEDVGRAPVTGDLRHLGPQGVLLLNTALTVPSGAAGGHARVGWDALTRQVLARLSDRPRAFLLWGNDARRARAHVRGEGHLFVESAHPSPLSARRGFFGSRPFGRVNDWLVARGESPVDWAGPDLSFAPADR